MSDREKIIELVSAGEVKNALQLLLKLTKSSKSQWQAETVVLASRYEELERREIEGTISVEEATLERNKIVSATLNVNDKWSEETAAPPLQRQWMRYGTWIIAGGLMAIAALAAWMAMRPMRGFEVEMDVWCSRASFRFLSGNAMLREQGLQNFKVQNFKKLEFQADTVRLETDFGGKKAGQPQLPFQSLLTLSPRAGVSGVEAAFTPAVLNDLDFSPGALLAFSVNGESPGELQLDVQQAERVAAELSYQKRTEFYSTYVRMEGLNGNSDWDDLGGIASAPTARKIFVEGTPGTTVFYFTLTDSLGAGTQQLEVSEPDFSKKENEMRVSSVLSATIKFTEGAQVYRQLTLDARKNLLPEPAGNFKLTRLNVTKKGIHLTLHGKLKELRTGENNIPENPTMGEWAWQVHRWKLLGAVAVLAVGLAAFSVRRKKLG